MTANVDHMWSLLSVEDNDRSFQGNDGYRDVTGLVYRYDSRVPNHQRVLVGHFVMLRDPTTVLGFGRLDEIKKELGSKRIRLCSTCGSSKMYRREVKRPMYRCQRCRAETDSPINEETEVTFFSAYYESSWTPMPTAVPVEEVRDSYVSQAVQNAIREMVLSRLLTKPVIGPTIAAIR